MEKVSLSVVEQLGDIPQMYRHGEKPTFPEDLVQVTDKLYDSGEIELAHQLLDVYVVYARFRRFCEFLTNEEGNRE